MDEASTWRPKRYVRRELEDSLWTYIVSEPEAESLLDAVNSHPKWASRSLFKPRVWADRMGYTNYIHVLHLAAAWSRPSCVRALLRSGAIDINKRSGRGTTALEEAAMRFRERFDEYDADNALECLRLIASHRPIIHSKSKWCGAHALCLVFTVPERMHKTLFGLPPRPAWLQYARAALSVLLASRGIRVFPPSRPYDSVVKIAIRLGEWGAANSALGRCTTHELLRAKRDIDYQTSSWRSRSDEQMLCAICNEITRRRRWIMRSFIVRALVLVSRRGAGRAVLRHAPHADSIRLASDGCAMHGRR